MSLIEWIFGPGFLLLAFTLVLTLFFLKEMKLFNKMRIGAAIMTLVVVGAAVIISGANPNMTDVVIPLSFLGWFIGMYILNLFMMKVITLTIWQVPYDDEKKLTKLMMQRAAYERLVHMPVGFMIIIAIVFALYGIKMLYDYVI